MKHLIILIFIINFLLACKVSRTQEKCEEKENSIVYILPDTVNRILQNELTKISKEGVYFYLGVDSGYYYIYISTQKNTKKGLPWVQRTNRLLFLDQVFYPLIFDLDEAFATPESRDSIKRKYATEVYPLISHTYLVYDGVRIKFKKDGTEATVSYNY